MGSYEGGQVDRSPSVEPHVRGHQRCAGLERQPEGDEATDPEHGVRDDQAHARLPHPVAQEWREPLQQGRLPYNYANSSPLRSWQAQPMLFTCVYTHWIMNDKNYQQLLSLCVG